MAKWLFFSHENVFQKVSMSFLFYFIAFVFALNRMESFYENRYTCRKMSCITADHQEYAS